jgi:hypothetical protein
MPIRWIGIVPYRLTSFLPETGSRPGSSPGRGIFGAMFKTREGRRGQDAPSRWSRADARNFTGFLSRFFTLQTLRALTPRRPRAHVKTRARPQPA